jgi:hypothetical protein
MPDFLFDFQKYIVEWALKKGRSAIFADCGLGKTPMQLVFAENIIRKTNKKVLILTPLAVSEQTKREGEKFGIDIEISKNGIHHKNIIVTNYERIHYFNPDDFIGCICDESSAIKAFDGKRRKQVTRFMSKIEYRLLCTATAAPNDYTELGTASEAIGVMTQSEMIDKYFQSTDKQRHTLFKDGDFWNRNKYFFKPHSEIPFWKWVTSWSRSLRMPSDLGDFDDSAFILPELIYDQHIVAGEYDPDLAIFEKEAKTLKEQRIERKKTMTQRCEKVAELVSHNKPAVVWCQYNQEGDELEKMIPDCVQVAGCDSDEKKEERLNDFSLGKVRVIVTKPKIGAFGLNWQHCGNHCFFPSHSFEQFYQGIRRSLRFGRKGSVKADIISTPGESRVIENLKAKQIKADLMFQSLIREMNNSIKNIKTDNHIKKVEVASWV